MISIEFDVISGCKKVNIKHFWYFLKAWFAVFLILDKLCGLCYSKLAKKHLANVQHGLGAKPVLITLFEWLLGEQRGSTLAAVKVPNMYSSLQKISMYLI